MTNLRALKQTVVVQSRHRWLIWLWLLLLIGFGIRLSLD